MIRLFATLVLVFLLEGVSFGQNNLYFSGSTVFTEVLSSADAYSVTAMSPDRFVVAYSDGNSWDSKFRVGEIKNDTTVVLGNPQSFSSELGVSSNSVTRLSNNRFLLIRRTNNYTEIRACEVINKDNVIVGPPFTLKSGFVYSFSQVSVTDSTFLIAYLDPNTHHGMCALGKVSDNLGISLGTAQSFSKSSIDNLSYMSIDTLSKSKFVVAHGYWNGSAVVGSIGTSGEITLGDSYKYTSQESYYVDAVGLSEDRFALVYTEDYDTWKGTLVLGTVNESNQVIYSGKLYFNENKTQGLSASKLSSDKLIILYNNSGGDSKRYAVMANVSNNGVELTGNIAYTEDISIHAKNPISTLDEKRIIVAHTIAGSFSGYIRLASTEKHEVVTSVEDEWNPIYTVYPNPTHNFLNLKRNDEGGYIDVKMFDLRGRTVVNEKFGPTSFIDLSGYQKGTYILQVNDGRRVMTKKVILL